MTAEVEGVQQALNRIKRYSLDVQEKVKDQVRMTSDEIVRSAKNKVPVRTGNLKEGIKSELLNNGFTAMVGTSDFYGRFIEYGHNVKNRRKGKVLGKAKPHPFLNPAFEEVKPGFMEEIKKAVKIE